MGDEERRTVWILGAGFSRSLGGPLLPDLLSSATNNFVSSLYHKNKFIGGPPEEPDDVYRRAALAVRRLYDKYGDTADPGIRLWENAEEFLDQLDAAAENESAASRIFRPMTSELNNAPWISGVETPDLRDAARRLVAAACCAFLHGANTNEERWQPYQAWAADLTSSDTVVTFNYDRVLETLGGFDVVVPAPPEVLTSQVVPLVPPLGAKPKVFKLHGSVDWRRELEKPVRYLLASPEYALECDGVNIGIATPGPTKRLATQELSRLWTDACEHIQRAEVIVFVGYRFPRTDAEARGTLLKAIRENKSPHLELHIVLGPDRRIPDVVRLQQLLRYRMASAGRKGQRVLPPSAQRMTAAKPANETRNDFWLMTHALYAEDFFTVWDRDVLWPPSEGVSSNDRVTIEPLPPD